MSKMLNTNSEKRISISNILSHPWLAKAESGLLVGEDEASAEASSAATTFSSLKLVLPGMALAPTPAAKAKEDKAATSAAADAGTLLGVLARLHQSLGSGSTIEVECLACLVGMMQFFRLA